MKFNKFLRLLANRRIVIIIILSALIISLPCLRIGFFLDDYMQRLAFIDNPREHELPGALKRSPFDMYTFVSSDREELRAIMDKGILPWWVDDKFQVSFWRPLTSLSFLIDYAFWSENPLLMHLHSILLFMLTGFLVTGMYRKINGRTWVAGLSALLFILNESLFVSVGWIACRNALLAILFCILTIKFLHNFIESKQKRWFLSSLACFALSILSAEAGIATVGYILSYTIFMDTRKIRLRIVSLLFYFLIVVLWFIVYTYLGYGTYGSDYYIHPFREPLRFILLVINRFFLMLASIFNNSTLELTLRFSSDVNMVLSIMAMLFSVATVIILKPLWIKCRQSLFWGLGMILALLPFCTTYSVIRNLAFATIGGMGFLARLTHNYLKSGKKIHVKKIWRITVGVAIMVLLVINLIISPIIFMISPIILHNLSGKMDSQIVIEQQADLAGKDLVIINSPSSVTSCWLYYMKTIFTPLPLPEHVRILSVGPVPVKIYRKDSQTLIVHPEPGYCPPPGPFPARKVQLANFYNPWYYEMRNERFFYSFNRKMEAGKVIELTGIKIKILSITADARPLEVEFTFDAPLEDKKWVLVIWNYKTNHMESFTLPETGTAILLGYDAFEEPAAPHGLDVERG